MGYVTTRELRNRLLVTQSIMRISGSDFDKHVFRAAETLATTLRSLIIFLRFQASIESNFIHRLNLLKRSLNVTNLELSGKLFSTAWLVSWPVQSLTAAFMQSYLRRALRDPCTYSCSHRLRMILNGNLVHETFHDHTQSHLLETQSRLGRCYASIFPRLCLSTSASLSSIFYK